MKYESTFSRQKLVRLYDQEFTESGSPEGKSENGMLVEDTKFMEVMQDVAKMANKHHQIPLLFRNPNIQLPNNRYQA